MLGDLLGNMVWTLFGDKHKARGQNRYFHGERFGLDSATNTKSIVGTLHKGLCLVEEQEVSVAGGLFDLTVRTISINPGSRFRS